MVGGTELHARKRRWSSPQRANPRPISHRGSLYDEELRSLCRGIQIPGPIFYTIEQRFADVKDENLALRERNLSLEKQASGCGITILEKNQQIHRMSKLIDSTTASVKSHKSKNAADNKKLIKELRKEIEERDTVLTMQREVLDFGTKVIEEKRVDITRLESEKEELGQAVGEREQTIGSLHGLIKQMQTASGDEMVGFALEAQAQRTLNMLQGLRATVTERDAAMAKLKMESVQQAAKIEAQKRKEKESLATIEDLARTRSVVSLQIAEARNIAEEQHKLIVRLLAENSRLQHSLERQ